MSDIQRYAHKHTFPTDSDRPGLPVNSHRHVHPRGDDHPLNVHEAHPPIGSAYYFVCVDCEPWRAQSAAVKEAVTP
jgi:hypothetical protein